MKINRDKIIYYSCLHAGDYFKVLKAINSKDYYKKCDIKAITIVDDDYPDCLRFLKYPPFCLFYKGDISLLKMSSVGIVGSRIVDLEIEQEVDLVVSNLNKNYCLVSGLARGVDGLSHKYGLRHGFKLISVLGSGIDYCYPRENQWLYDIEKYEHLILSEYPFATKPAKQNFPFRNRIIAALSEKMIIIAAKINSGSMHTVDFTLELSKDIYCLPKNIRSLYDGNNYLIKNGANIICDIEDIRSI